MRAWPRIALLVGLFLFLLAFAHSPLLQSGWLAPDVALLSEARRAGDASSVRPLAKASLALSVFLWGAPERASSATFLRLEHVALLLVSALGLGLFARRLLLPWCGSEQARGAAYSAAAFFCLYPLNTPAVASVAARGVLIGVALGACASALFIRGRQDRNYAFLAMALMLVLVAGFATDRVLGLPLLFALAEYVSAHRYRRRGHRLRTSLTTALVFGMAVCVEPVVRGLRARELVLPEGLAQLAWSVSGGETLGLVSSAVEKLGLLVLPANPLVLGITGIAIAGFLFLLAMQPALVAARTAPRLWGWLLVGWFASLAVSELFHTDLRIDPHEFHRAWALLPSTAVMVVGLGLGATALSGSGRPFVACGVAIGFACLAHGNALPWKSASLAAEQLAGDLRAAVEEHGSTPLYLVIDPPHGTQGVEPLGGEIAVLATTGSATATGAELAGPRVRGLSERAFLAWVREPEFALERRAAPLVCLVPEQPEAAGAGRVIRLLPAPRTASGPMEWSTNPTSPRLDLDPLVTGALRVDADPGDLAALSEVTWETKREPVTRGTHGGVWEERPEGAVGLFDLGSSLEWRLASRIGTLVFEQSSRTIRKAQILDDLPALEGVVFQQRDGDWLLGSVDLTGAVSASDSAATLRLTLLDLDTLEAFELELVPESAERTLWRAVGAETWVAERGGPVSWSLDHEIDGRAVARKNGRR